MFNFIGRIAFSNVVSDLYATGVTNIDSVKLILSIPDGFSETERDIVVPMMVNGFIDSAKLGGCKVDIGNFSVNPWCLIGGIGTSICSRREIIM